MVNTKKFSEFSVALQNNSDQEVVGLEAGVNIRSDRFLTWTTAGRPASPFNGLLGFNTTLQQYEFWDSVALAWTQLEDSGDISGLLALLASHAVGEGASLIGLQNQSGVTNKTVQDLANATFIAQTDNGTLQNAQFLGSLTTGIVKNTTTTGVLSISAPITSIDNLTTVANNLIYTTASNTYAVITPVASSLLVSSAGGVPSWSNTQVPGFTMIGNLILNGDASQALQAVTLQQLQAAVLNSHAACLVSTTANLAGYTYANGVSGVGATLTAGANGAFSSDGVSPALNSRIFVPFQTSQLENGIYVLTQVGTAGTPAILTRAADFDSTAEINAGDVVSVVSGTLYGGTTWMMTQTLPVVVGTTAITFSNITNTGALLIANNLSELTATASIARANISAAKSGANSDITSMTGLTGVLQAPTLIASSAGLAVLEFVYLASSVNHLYIQNAPTGQRPAISVTGTDSAIPIHIATKNSDVHLTDNVLTVAPALRFYNAAATHFTGLKVATAQATDLTLILPAVDGSANFIMKTNGSAVLSFTNGSQIAGTATNDNASAGNIGEFISSIIAQATPVAYVNNTAINVTSISLTAGDWDVWGNIALVSAGAAAVGILSWTSTTSATAPDASLYSGIVHTAALISASSGANAPYRRYSLSATTTIYLGAYVTNTGAVGSVCGAIYARRAR